MLQCLSIYLIFIYLIFLGWARTRGKRMDLVTDSVRTRFFIVKGVKPMFCEINLPTNVLTPVFSQNSVNLGENCFLFFSLTHSGRRAADSGPGCDGRTDGKFLDVKMKTEALCFRMSPKSNRESE